MIFHSHMASAIPSILSSLQLWASAMLTTSSARRSPIWDRSVSSCVLSLWNVLVAAASLQQHRLLWYELAPVCSWSWEIEMTVAQIRCYSACIIPRSE